MIYSAFYQKNLLLQSLHKEKALKLLFFTLYFIDFDYIKTINKSIESNIGTIELKRLNIRGEKFILIIVFKR